MGRYEARENVVVVEAPVVVSFEGLVVLVHTSAVYEFELEVVVDAELARLAYAVCQVHPLSSWKLATVVSCWKTYM